MRIILILLAVVALIAFGGSKVEQTLTEQVILDRLQRRGTPLRGKYRRHFESRQGYGVRNERRYASSFHYHTGDDLATPIGEPFYASLDGKVTFAGWNNPDKKTGEGSGYGLNIFFYMPSIHETDLTAHLSEIYVRAGQFVKAGTLLGRTGNSGDSSGPHSHNGRYEGEVSGNVKTKLLSPEYIW